MDVRVGPSRKLNIEELMLLTCGVGEDFSEALGSSARSSKQSFLKEPNSEYSIEGHAQPEARIFWPPDVKN